MNGSSRAQHRYVDFGIIAACIVWSIWAGKDLNWDLRNYHYYLPHSLLENRVSRDFFPASIQSYLNPISYLPFYWMVNAGWSSVAVSSVLAIFQSLNLLVLWRITCLLFASPWPRALTFVLGAAAPIYWVEVGTSFNDASTSVLVLYGVYLVLKWRPNSEFSSRRSLWLGGLFFGAATALKLTNAPFALAAPILLYRRRLSFRESALNLVSLGVGGLLGFAALGGYWCYILWQEFGNPLFPFFNNIFCSPDFPCSAIRAARFAPLGLASVAYLPFEIATPVAWVYTETTSPDIRFAISFTVWIILLGVLGWKSHDGLTRRDAIDGYVPGRLILPAYAFVSWILWVGTSANGRYGIPIELLVGLVFAIAVQIIAPKYLKHVLMVVCAAQLIQVVLAADSRWSSAQWRQTWFEGHVPEGLREHAYLFLSVGQQTNAFVVPWLNSKSAYVNFVGQNSLAFDAAGGARLKKLLADYSGRTRMMATVTAAVLNGPRPSASYIGELNIQFSKIGMAVSSDDCQFIEAQAPSSILSSTPYKIMSCKLYSVPMVERSEFERRAERVMDMIEERCKKLLNPSGVATERNIKGLRRYYVGTEIQLYVSRLGRVYMSKVRVPNDYDLGTLENWESDSGAISCPAHSRSSPWFRLSNGNPPSF